MLGANTITWFLTDLSSETAGPMSSICTRTPGKSACNSPKTASCRSSFSGPEEMRSMKRNGKQKQNKLKEAKDSHASKFCEAKRMQR